VKGPTRSSGLASFCRLSSISERRMQRRRPNSPKSYGTPDNLSRPGLPSEDRSAGSRTSSRPAGAAHRAALFSTGRHDSLRSHRPAISAGRPQPSDHGCRSDRRLRRILLLLLPARRCWCLRSGPCACPILRRPELHQWHTLLDSPDAVCGAVAAVAWERPANSDAAQRACAGVASAGASRSIWNTRGVPGWPT